VIDAVSSAERITLVEHGVALRSNPNGPIISKADFYENYLGKGDPDEYMAELDEEQMFEEYIKPGLIQQELVARYGSQIVMGPDGDYVGPDGRPLQPEDVLAANGIPPEVVAQLAAMLGVAPAGAPPMGGAPMPGPMVPGGMPMQQGAPMAGVGSMGTTTGALPPLPGPPGTMGLGGMVG
jgi:hypothetical protein